VTTSHPGLLSFRTRHSSDLRAHYGYPTPALGRDAALNAIHPELEKIDIYSRGRFGGWKYEISNQDHSLMQGVELVNKLALDIPEDRKSTRLNSSHEWISYAV